MKALIRFWLYGVLDTWFRYRFRRMLDRADDRTKVYLVDIDNTLAHSWPSLQQYVYRNEQHRYASLPIFIGMRNFILDKIRQRHRVVFISARSYQSYFTTCKWLISCGIRASELILVPGANLKLFYINYLISKGIPVVYIDDLSYNHEHGEVKLYDDLIREVSCMSIDYFGIREIDLINSNDEFTHQNHEKVLQDI